MKARIRYWNGYYWCRRMGITGQGLTIQEAWDDMWKLYREFIAESRRPTFSCRPLRA